MNNNTIPEILGPLSSQIDASYALELMEGLSAELDYKEFPVGQRFTMDTKKIIKFILFVVGPFLCTASPMVFFLNLSKHRVSGD